MKLTLKRIALRDTYTIGRLYINGKYFCDSIEDKVRNLDVEPKVYAQTAIPYGSYEITLKVQSPKFSKSQTYAFCRGFLPRLLNVPHFEGILIHIGNRATQSAGCILVGRNTIVGQVTQSTETFRALYNILKGAHMLGEKITIDIIPPSLHNS